MRTIEQDPDVTNHFDVFEQNIANIQFGPVSSDHDPQTRLLLDLVRRQGHQVTEGDLRITFGQAPPSRIFKISNPRLYVYVEICPANGTFLYVQDLEHKETVNPNVVIAEMIARNNGVNTRFIKKDDGSGILDIKGKGALVLPWTDAQRETEAKSKAARWRKK